MLVPWNDRYATGIDEVDFEHRELVELVNRIHDTYVESNGGAPAIAALFGDLNRAIAAHFALEEHHMRAAGYRALPAHKADHERLLDDLRDMMDAHEAAGTRVDAAELGRALDAWFSVHFGTHDAKLFKAIGHHP
ncbi:bacteriohemerythrin [Prosthecomicrobium sp. N25]|uniref:bacteriohemerythrin n=1 Tax=Prosthecomicrobium sp. N25 TaxID=3129254 RepID=UPI00307698D0